jgi:hypothetical protein
LTSRTFASHLVGRQFLKRKEQSYATVIQQSYTSAFNTNESVVTLRVQ